MARNFVRTSSHMMEYAAAIISAVPLTFAAWVRMSTTIGAHSVLCVNTDGSNNNRFGLLLSGGRPSAIVQDAVSNVSTTATIAVTAGTWVHVTGVFTSTTSIAVYRDNVVYSATTAEKIPSGMNRTTIGRNSSTTTNYFDGDIAEAAIWNVALTAADVAQLVAGFSPMFARPDALVAYWPLIGRDSPEGELIAKQEMVNTNSTVASHPRILRPRPTRGQFWESSAAAVGAYRLVGRPATLAGTGGLAG